MIPFQVIYYIAFLTFLLSINGVESTRNTNYVSFHLTNIGHSWQYGTNDDPFHKFVNQFGLYPQKNETRIFRIVARKMERWKNMLKSHSDVDVELVFWSQEQTIINVYKTCEEMTLAEFALLYQIIDTTSNNLLIIDSDNGISNRISILVQIVTKCNHCTQSGGKFSPTIYFPNRIVSKKQIDKLERICHKAMLPLPRDLKYKNAVYSWMPRIFASATEHKYSNFFYHGIKQSRTNKAYQDLRSQHVLSIHRRRHHVYSKTYKLLKLRREQKTMQKISKEASDVLEVPVKKRKLLCKYRKSCYDTDIIPNTWNAHKILPTFMELYETQNNFSEKESITEMQIRKENEEKEEISEAELKLLCRYRKSCYKQMGARIENDLKVQAGFIFSRSITVLSGQKRKSIEEIASIALAKIEKKEKIAALRPITKKKIDKDLNKIEKKMKRRLICKYRKSCYDSGIRPEIDSQFGRLFQKIYCFLWQRINETGIQKTIHKRFNNLKDDEKKIYCKYRKSCYITGKKPIIYHHQVFEYMHIVKKQGVIPLETRCKYRKSCYETGILPDLKKRIAKKETSPMISMQTVTSLYHFKIFCKYRKSCYKRKAEKRKNSNTGKFIEATGQFNKAKTFDNDESEQKKDDREIKEIIKSLQKKSVFKSKKIEESKTERAFETKPTKETNNKNFRLKKSKIFMFEKEKRMTAATENKKVKETINKSRKKKIKESAEETQAESAMKVQKTILPITIRKQPVIEKRVPEHARFKKQRLKIENKEKEIKNERIKNEGIIIKEKKIPKDFENKSLSFLSPLTAPDMSSTSIKEVQPLSLQDENMSLKEANIYNKNLDPLAIRLLCKYRKSCYANDKVSLIKVLKKVQDFQEKKKYYEPLEIRCKYRKSCYETGKLPENFHNNLKMTYSIKNKEEPIPITMKCKYRKSCYETGKLPPIEKGIFRFSTVQILDDYEKQQFVEKQVNSKLRCKYRKSCYASGILPSYLNHTVSVIDTSTKQYESLQLKCKHRKSCYGNMKLDIQLDKIRKKEEQKKMQEGFVKSLYQTESVIKYKEKGEKNKVLDEVTDEKSKRTRKKKIKELKSETKELKYMQIQPLESRSRKAANKSRPLNSSQKLRCKYRLKCYDDISHQLAEEKKTEEKRQLSIKDFRRANGAICNIYYISCRKQAGLPILVRAPIGPNGRRLCRKKKKENINN